MPSFTNEYIISTNYIVHRVFHRVYFSAPAVAITITHIPQLVKTIANMFSPRLRSESFLLVHHPLSFPLSLSFSLSQCLTRGDTMLAIIPAKQLFDGDNQVLNSWRQPLVSCIRRVEPLCQGRNTRFARYSWLALFEEAEGGRNKEFIRSLRSEIIRVDVWIALRSFFGYSILWWKSYLGIVGEKKRKESCVNF